MTLDDVAAAHAKWVEAQTLEREARAQLVTVIREARPAHSLAEIARVLGVSRQRVEQLSKDQS